MRRHFSPLYFPIQRDANFIPIIVEYFVISANPTTHEFCLLRTLYYHLGADISFTLGTLTLTGQDKDRRVCHDTFTIPLTISLTECVHLLVSKMYSITTILNWGHSKTSFILAPKRENPDFNPFYINKTKSNNGTNKTITNNK
jgi:hypothetical protein